MLSKFPRYRPEFTVARASVRKRRVLELVSRGDDRSRGCNRRGAICESVAHTYTHRTIIAHIPRHAHKVLGARLPWPRKVGDSGSEARGRVRQTVRVCVCVCDVAATPPLEGGERVYVRTNTWLTYVHVYAFLLSNRVASHVARDKFFFGLHFHEGEKRKRDTGP